MTVENTSAVVIAGLAVALGFVAWRYAGRQYPPLPPGPRGWPILGNALDIPKDYPEHQFAKWGDEYGDIMSITALGTPMIILNSSRAAIGLLEQKHPIASDRPILPFGGEMVGWADELPFMQYDQPWKDLRKIMHQGIGTMRNMEREGYARQTEDGASRFLLRILDRKGNGDIGDIIRKSFGGFVLKMSFGYDIQEEGEDHYIKMQETLVDQINEFSVPGAFLVDIIPWLKYVPAWVPGAGFQTKAKEWRAVIQRITREPHENTKKQMAAGTAVPSFTSHRLSEKNLTYKEEEDVRKAIATIYGAGVDTTSAAIHSFFLVMSLYPDIQARAKAEIDGYLSKEGERLPGISDREHLPYIDAITKEVLRWNPVGALGVPHRINQDEIHGGYFLPKNSIIFQNLWKILHDPNTYKDPMEFEPARFLGATPEEDPRHAAFGYGRRTCPGNTLADAAIFVFAAMSLSVFDIYHGAAGEGAGKMSLAELKARVVFTPGIVSSPKPFDIVVKPRSAKAEALIRAVNDTH